MSIDTKYIIQYEGPFGTNELQEQLDALNALPNSFGFQQFGYDLIIGEVKRDADEEILEITKKASCIQILSSNDSSAFWTDLWRITDKK